MTKEQIIDKIYEETFNMALGATRVEEITAYIVLWEKYKKQIEK